MDIDAVQRITEHPIVVDHVRRRDGANREQHAQGVSPVTEAGPPSPQQHQGDQDGGTGKPQQLRGRSGHSQSDRLPPKRTCAVPDEHDMDDAEQRGHVCLFPQTSHAELD